MSREMGGGELVCRLVAATPTYLYTPAGLPHSFFFSELLRGLVEARAKRGGSPPPKRLRGGIGSAFRAPTLPDSISQTQGVNMLSISRLIPRLEEVYKGIRDNQKQSLPAVIGLELVVDYMKHEKSLTKCPTETT